MTGVQTCALPISSRTYTINYASATLTTSFGVSGAYGAIWEYSGSREKVTSIVLPNGRSYTFSYDSYGSVTQMTFPTGATINYTWANYPNASCTYRYVSSRTVTVNGQSSTWTFSHAPVGTATCNGLTQVGSDVTVTQTDPLSNQTVYTVSRGNVKTAKFYQGAATGTPLRQYTVEYTDYNNASGSLPPLYLPTRITTQLEDGRQSKKEFTYDTLNMNRDRKSVV